MTMITPLSGPSVKSSRPVQAGVEDARVSVKQSLATSMPSDRQTSLGMVQVEVLMQIHQH